jgi:hypothetical protein
MIILGIESINEQENTIFGLLSLTYLAQPDILDLYLNTYFWHHWAIT